MSARHPQSESTVWLSTQLRLSSVTDSESEDSEVPLIVTIPVIDCLARCKIDEVNRIPLTKNQLRDLTRRSFCGTVYLGMDRDSRMNSNDRLTSNSPVTIFDRGSKTVINRALTAVAPRDATATNRQTKESDTR